MGATLPVTGITAPTVLIGGLPAARQTDFCACVAPIPVPVDPIILGSPVVLIMGLPATFVGAPTAKGGVILPPGCPTVLIGFAGVPTPVLPGMPVPKVMVPTPPGSTSQAMTVTTGTAKQNPICTTLAVQLVEIGKARGDAMMAGAVYGEPGAELPPNTRRATREDLEALGLHDGVNDMTKLDDSNFRSEVFVEKDPISGQESYVVAFKGTTMTSLEDWGANVAQGLGMQNAYYDQAALIGKTSTNFQPGKVRFVGHSLGGGLASAAAASSGAPAQTFNAAGLHPDTVARQGGAADTSKVNAWYVEGDILSAAQDTLPMKEAAGLRKALAAPPQPPGIVQRIAQAAGAFLGNILGGPLGALAGAIGADKLLAGVNLHLMGSVMGAIDQEAARIADEQKKNGCK